MLQGSKLDFERLRPIKTCHKYLPEAIKNKQTKTLTSICMEPTHSLGTTWWQRKVLLLLQENWQLMLKRPEIMGGFQASVDKDSVGERVPGCLIS